MPPVQIPTIQRIQPQNEPAGPRIEAKAINVAQGQGQVNEAIGKLAETGINIYAKYEDQAASTAAKAAAIEYHQYLEKKLEGDPTSGILGLKHFQGDPTEAYQQFDTDSMLKQVDIQNKYADASSTTKFKVQQQLQEVSAKFFDRKTINYGNQLNQYGIKTNKAYGDMILQNTVNESGLLDASKPDTFKNFDANLNLIVGNAFAGADLMGLPASHPSVQMNAFEQRSKALVDTIGVLTKSKKLQEANLLMDKYKDGIDSAHVDKIVGDLRKATIESEALDFIAKNKSKGPQALWAAAEKIPDKYVREEAEIMLAAKEHKMSFLKREQEDLNNDAIMKYAMQRQAGQIKGTPPFKNFIQAERDPNIKPYIEKISPEQRATFRKYLTKVEKSDPKVINILNELYATDQYASIPAKDFTQLSIGLNETDQNKFWGLWRSSQRVEETELFRRSKNAYIAFETMAEEYNLVEPKRPGKARFEEDAITLNAANDYFIAQGKTLPTDPAQLNAIVKNYAIRLKNKEKQGFFPSLFGKKEEIPMIPIPEITYKKYLLPEQNAPVAPPIKPTPSKGVVIPVQDTKVLATQKEKALSAKATDDEKSEYYKSIKGNYPVSKKQLSDFIQSEMPK